MNTKKTKIRLPYGVTSLEIDVPSNNLSAVLERKKHNGPDDEVKEIREALHSPIESLPISKSLGSKDKVAVIVTDNTRACPDDRILPVILEEIEQKVPRKNISIIVALGLHQKLDKQSLIGKLGGDIVEKYRVLNHDSERTIHLGTTSRGTPVEIYEEVAKADFILSTGFIEPHFFAGFSGGRKSIAPGVSSVTAIRSNHSYEMISHKYARAGILHGNPVHEDMVEQAKMAGLNFIVNVLLNTEGKITAVFAGDGILAHEKACDMERGHASSSIDSEADITIVTNGGAPLDLDLYQTCKAIDTAAQITKKGGIIIVASQCKAGIGPRDFCNLHAVSKSPSEVLERIGEGKHTGEHTGVQWQNQILARCQCDHEIFLVSDLNHEEVKNMMIRPVVSVQEGIETALTMLGKDAKIAVIPEGPRILPFLA